MASNQDTALDRIGALESRHEVFAQGLNRLEKMTEGLTQQFSQFMKEQSQAPRSIPFKEIVTTAAATFALGTTILLFLDNRSQLTNQPHIERVKDQSEKIARLEYKLERLQDQIAPISFAFKRSQGAP